ncbi:alpha/beta fold hydrolase [Cognatishimia sp. MH4019]|uniref:alpha/beta fold hydrolase n=1 Tax=Cognatishimia sp. MH4019 TaxID=2854030 RepID=UPI001CD64526|nr:alpha/beta hydrolase [Cognatishimia sp. MH4019]
MPRFTTSDGLSLHYTDEGAGLPMICLAGLTRNGSDFDYVAPHLSDVRLIRLDYRGRGQSDWADDYLTYAIPIEGRDCVELMGHLGLKRAAILGTSRGGLISMALAATVKDRLLGVALNDIGPELNPAGLEVIKTYIGHNPPQQTHAEAAAIRETMPGFANVPEGRWLEEMRKQFRETEDGLVIRYDPKLRDAVLEAGAPPAPDLWPFFDAFDGLPLCAIRGANSDLLSAQTLAEMQRRRPDMIAAVVPDRAHIPFLDEPESVAALRQWIEAMQ